MRIARRAGVLVTWIGVFVTWIWAATPEPICHGGVMLA